jgi:DNA-directed RNA polymerase subunit E"
MGRERACKGCHLITRKDHCPKCNGQLSDDFAGILVVVKPTDSQVAKALKIDRPGKYALRVR